VTAEDPRIARLRKILTEDQSADDMSRWTFTGWDIAPLLAAYDSLLGSVDVEAEKKAQEYHASECVWKQRAERAERRIDAALALQKRDEGMGNTSVDARSLHNILTTTPEKPEDAEARYWAGPGCEEDDRD
jgi:hypothetical protein